MYLIVSGTPTIPETGKPMKVGDIVRFKKTGVVGTVVEVFGLYDDDDDGAVRVLAHNVEKVIPNPSVFSVSNLKRVADVISPS